MRISKELSAINDRNPLQGNGNQSCFSEADHIKFSGVKVTNLVFFLNFNLGVLHSHALIGFDFQVVTPTNNVLVEDLTLTVDSGSNLLITGSCCF